MRRRRALAGVALLLAASACDTITSPTTLVYADRPVVVPAAAMGWRSVSVGGAHTCGVRTEGEVYCWGSNGGGQLGVAVARGRCTRLRSACEGSPRAVTTPLRVTEVSAGLRHTCAIAVGGSLHCWGENLRFQTASNGQVIARTPAPVLPGLQFIHVSSGMTHTCAVRTNGVVYCWGDGTLGALGRGDTVSSVIPAPVKSSERFVVVRAGRLRSCAIALDASLWCWGAEWESSSGGFDFYHERTVPHRIDGLPPLRDVSVSSSSLCALSLDGEALCWESNAFAQLGMGNTENSPTPAFVNTHERFTSVSSGIIQSCATALDGRAFCWGNNSFGQLGVPRPTERCSGLECSSLPIAVFGQQRFTAVATGLGNHTCGVTVHTALLCWGLGSDGQLGDGFTRDRQSLPVGVLAPSP